MSNRTLSSAGAIAATLTVLTAAACSSLTGGNGGSATLSFHAAGTAATAPGASLNLSTAPVSDGTHTLDLQSVDFTVSEVVFERTDGQTSDDDDSETDSDSEGSHNSRFQSGATTISVPLTGGMIAPFSGNLAAGSYDRVELDVEFVRLRGTYDGQAFDVTVPVNRELELRLSPPLVVDGSTVGNVTVNIDFASWLSANGALIDPRTLTSSTALSLFRDRVKASFKATEDSDRDGDESDSDSDG
ncbi:MAG: hypothetical protein ABIR92_04200 [Gemmatimonadaceae bacterium]